MVLSGLLAEYTRERCLHLFCSLRDFGVYFGFLLLTAEQLTGDERDALVFLNRHCLLLPEEETQFGLDILTGVPPVHPLVDFGGDAIEDQDDCVQKV